LTQFDGPGPILRLEGLFGQLRNIPRAQIIIVEIAENNTGQGFRLVGDIGCGIVIGYAGGKNLGGAERSEAGFG